MYFVIITIYIVLIKILSKNVNVRKKMFIFAFFPLMENGIIYSFTKSFAKFYNLVYFRTLLA